MSTGKKRRIAFIEMMGKTSKVSAVITFVASLAGYLACIALDISESKEINKRINRANNNNNKRQNQSW